MDVLFDAKMYVPSWHLGAAMFTIELLECTIVEERLKHRKRGSRLVGGDLVPRTLDCHENHATAGILVDAGTSIRRRVTRSDSGSAPLPLTGLQVSVSNVQFLLLVTSVTAGSNPLEEVDVDSVCADTSSVENHGCHAAVSGKPRCDVHSCDIPK